MSLVSGRFLADFLRAIGRVNIDVDSLVGDLPVECSTPYQRHPLIEWDVFVELMVRLERRVGGQDGLEHLGELITDMKPAPVLCRIAGSSASPTAIYNAALKWALPRAFPNLEVEAEELEDGRLVISSVIAAGDSPCPQLFHVARGAARALPRILGLPDAVVSAEIDGHGGRFTISPPPSGTLLARIRRALRAFFSSRKVLMWLEMQQLELRSHIDALQRAYGEVRESEARHRALADSLVDVMIEFDEQGRILFASPSVEELTGYRQDQVIGSNFSLWIHREQVAESRQFVADTTRLGQPDQPAPVFRMHHEGGEWIWVEVAARSFATRDGERHAVAILRDVSDRVSQTDRMQRRGAELEQMVAERTDQLERRNRDLRELQALLLQAEREGAARDLAGHVAHSINNRLGALILHLEDAAQTGDIDQRSLQHAVELAHLVGDVSHRTLDLYREGKVSLGPVRVAELRDDLLQELAPRAEHFGIQLDTWLDPKLDVIEADRSLLLSGLLSIAENSIDAMRGGGRLGIEIGRDVAGESVEIRIWDTGPGIPAEVRRNIFDTYFTTKAEGTGLGLAIARSVVRGHGGHIEAGEHAGGGGLVTVELPAMARDGARRQRDEPED
jgi:PAS domain S-box-containing protein